MSHLPPMLGDMEKEIQWSLLQQHREHLYASMLDGYCHEGYHQYLCQDGTYCVGVCSYEATAKDADDLPRAIKEVADHIRDRIEHHGELGC